MTTSLMSPPNEPLPQAGDVWFYLTTGKFYKIESLCMIKTYKEGTENGWSKGVAYRPIHETPLQNSLYVRELEEFSAKFYLHIRGNQ